MRLIDADALKEKAAKFQLVVDKDKIISTTYQLTADELNSLPTIDAVEVVRCRDCKFSELFQNDSRGVMARYCKAFTFKRMVADNDFCSYGERKDNEID